MSAKVMDLDDACTPSAAGIVLIAGFGGLRCGEMGALEPPDVDLEFCEVTVCRALGPALEPSGHQRPPMGTEPRRSIGASLRGWRTTWSRSPACR